MTIRLLACLSVAALLCGPAHAPAREKPKPKVYVILWFDTEDYILPASDDAALRVADWLSKEGVPVEQWRILKILSDGNGHSMGELAEAVLLNHPTLTKMIDRMVVPLFNRVPGVGGTADPFDGFIRKNQWCSSYANRARSATGIMCAQPHRR